MSRLIVALGVAALLLVGCATPPQMGDKAAEAELKKFTAAPGKTSLYVCRVSGFVASGIVSPVLVDGESIGRLAPKTFAHTLVNPGTHTVKLDHSNYPLAHSPSHTIETKANEVAFVWVGVTGGGWGVYTVDDFKSRQEGMDCVNSSDYVTANK